MGPELNVLALSRVMSAICMSTMTTAATMLRAFQDHAADVRLSLNWFDAAPCCLRKPANRPRRPTRPAFSPVLRWFAPVENTDARSSGRVPAHLGLEKNSSAHTVKSYREDLTQAMEFFPPAWARGVRPAQLTTRLSRSSGLADEQGYARSTIARRLAAVAPGVASCAGRERCRQPGRRVARPRQDKSCPTSSAATTWPLAGGAAGRHAPGLARSGHPRNAVLRRVARERLTGLDVATSTSATGSPRWARQGRKERLALLGPPAVEA